MRRVAIAGVGLIGGSFGLALRKAGFTGEILGISSPRTIAAAQKVGAISGPCSFDDALQSADLIYLAQPIDVILRTVESFRTRVRQDCLITDAGSTKYLIVDRAVRLLPPGTFLGGHPMAGKERRGVEHADANLFAGKPYVLTPQAVETAQQAEFKEWLRRIGADIQEMDAREHDATVALTSHLPQLLSTTLASVLGNSPNPFVTKIFGSGLLDMTRLALSSADIWKSVIDSNRDEIAKALDAYVAALDAVRQNLKADGAVAGFEAGQQFAERIRSKK